MAFPADPAVISSYLKPPVPPRARSSGAYLSRNVGSQGSLSSILSERSGKVWKRDLLVGVPLLRQPIQPPDLDPARDEIGHMGPEVALLGNIFLQLLISLAHLLSKRLQLIGGCVPFSVEGVTEDTQPVVLPPGLSVQGWDRRQPGWVPHGHLS